MPTNTKDSGRIDRPVLMRYSALGNCAKKPRLERLRLDPLLSIGHFFALTDGLILRSFHGLRPFTDLSSHPTDDGGTDALKPRHENGGRDQHLLVGHQDFIEVDHA